MSETPIQGSVERRCFSSPTPMLVPHELPRAAFSEKKRADLSVTQAQRPTGADYRTLFDQSDIPVALVSGLGAPRFVAASRGFLDMFDLRRAAIAGRGLGEVFAS